MKTQAAWLRAKLQANGVGFYKNADTGNWGAFLDGELIGTGHRTLAACIYAAAQLLGEKYEHTSADCGTSGDGGGDQCTD
jgi:hypothetical protein